MRKTGFGTATFAVLVLISIALTAQQPPAPDFGSVRGVLWDLHGEPAKGFVVTIIGTSPTSTFQMETLTDENGIFSVKYLKFGSYAVTTRLDTIDSHHPPSTGAFFGKHLLRFEIGSDSPQANLTVTLDPPCLVISGVVVDGESKHSVSAQIHMWHKDDTEKWVKFGTTPAGNYRMWLPPREAVEMEVSAPGYEVYRTLIPAIENGEDRVLDVELTPLPASNH